MRRSMSLREQENHHNVFGHLVGGRVTPEEALRYYDMGTDIRRKWLGAVGAGDNRRPYAPGTPS